MSRTIITNSGSEFFTNVNSEQLLGVLCMLANAKYFKSPIGEHDYRLAYSMTKEEVEDTIEKLKSLKEHSESIFPQVKDYFEKGCTVDDLNQFIDDSIVDFRISEGYHCI